MDNSEGRTYMCIDLKSFYASVECAARGLDPFTTNLVVADPTRTETTICLAITPAMKALGVKNRCRVFEIPRDMDYIMAPPRMRYYMEVSAGIFAIYLRFISPSDIFAYSIDECFIDATPYLDFYGKDATGLARMLMGEVFRETGITATAGIGTNLFLAKLALDITAKHVKDNIGVLNEAEFRRTLWHHRPITDVWNIGPGIARRLAKYRVFDLHGITQMDPDVLYGEFGVNAEFLIDHAWGIEPCTIAQIQGYKPQGSSITNGQVLPSAYSYADAHAILHEMVDSSVLELVDNRIVAGRVSLHVGYEIIRGCARSGAGVQPRGGDGADWRAYAKACGSGNGSHTLAQPTSSLAELVGEFDALWERCVDPGREVRRISIGFDDLRDEADIVPDLFSDLDALERERTRQEAILDVKRKFGKNALLRASHLGEKSTFAERNTLVGGHRG